MAPINSVYDSSDGAASRMTRLNSRFVTACDTALATWARTSPEVENTASVAQLMRSDQTTVSSRTAASSKPSFSLPASRRKVPEST